MKRLEFDSFRLDDFLLLYVINLLRIVAWGSPTEILTRLISPSAEACFPLKGISSDQSSGKLSTSCFLPLSAFNIPFTLLNILYVLYQCYEMKLDINEKIIRRIGMTQRIRRFLDRRFLAKVICELLINLLIKKFTLNFVIKKLINLICLA